MPSELALPWEFGDILLVRFPFTSHTASKKRPAVIVSSGEYNQAKPDLVVMAITSQLRAAASLGEVWVTEWRMANLLKPSAIKPVFATIERALIVKRLGTSQAPDISALRTAISIILR